MKKKIIISGQLLLGGMYMKNNRKKFLLALLIIFASFFVTSCGGGGGGSVMDAINALLGISVDHTTWEWKDRNNIVQIAFGEGTYTVKESTDGGTNFTSPVITGNFSFNQAEKRITLTNLNVTSTPIESNKFKISLPGKDEREFTKK